MLVEVAARHDPHAFAATRIEDGAHLAGELAEVAAVEAHRLHRYAATAQGHHLVRRAQRVVGVDEQRQAMGMDAGEIAEGRGLVVVGLDERVRHRAGEGNPEETAGLDRRRGVESRDVAGARGEQAGLGALRAAQSEVHERRGPAARRQRAALLAIMLWKLSRLMIRLSTNWASGSGAVTRRIGSPAKNTLPSGMASTSPVKRNSSRRRSASDRKRRCPRAIAVRRTEPQPLEVVECLLESRGQQEARAAAAGARRTRRSPHAPCRGPGRPSPW